jgi:ABC-type glycerol-3-phosphate transport system substrate-binding protein
MHRAPKFVVIALLLAAALVQTACGNDTLSNATSSSAATTSKKFWDRCINGECPPMNEDDGKPKSRPQ